MLLFGTVMIHFSSQFVISLGSGGSFSLELLPR